MNKEEKNGRGPEELVPPMPEAFSEAVDKAVFSAIRKENEQKQAERLEEKKQSRRQWWRRMGAAAAAGILLLATAFTIGLGLMSRENKALENTEAPQVPVQTEKGEALSEGAETAEPSEAPKETEAGKKDVAVTPAPVEVGEPWDGDLYNIPLYSNPAPKAVRYDLTEGYVYADTVFDLVQEKLRWLNENDYDELWLAAVMDLSKADFENVTYHGSSYFSASKSGWMKKQNTLFALVQYDFGEGEGPLLAEFQLDESGKPVSCDIKALSCDPELDGRYYRKTSEYGSPAVYVLYGTGARAGQLTCGDYTIDFTSSLPLEQVREKLKDSAHKEHIREWYLYPAPAEPGVKLYTAEGKNKLDFNIGPTAKQILTGNEEAALRVTFDGETRYAKAAQIESGLETQEKEERIHSFIQRLPWAWDDDYADTFCLSVDQRKEHSLRIETNLPEMTVKQIYVYQPNSHLTAEQWVQSSPKTAEELLMLEPDLGERVVCFLVESQGQEYVVGFSMFLHGEESHRGNGAPVFTSGARRYDLTGGWEYSEGLLDAVEEKLQSKNLVYDELWLEAVYDFSEDHYGAAEKQYGQQVWMEKGEWGFALVQYNFSEGAGPMLVEFTYDNVSKQVSTWIVLEKLDPELDVCYGVRLGDGDDPYAIPCRYYCAGTDASAGVIKMSRALLRFTSQLPLEQVQELVKDSPYKDAAREWYLLPVPAVGTMTLYDAEGNLRPLRKGKAVYGVNYQGIQEPYVDQNAS